MILLRNAADVYRSMAYHSLRFSRYHFFSHQKFRASALMADKCLLCDGEDGSDSAGTGGASIPNYLHHLTNDLLMEGSFILGGGK